MANNENNLKPQNTRTKEEQREIAKQGGKASGEARRQKRDLKRAIQILLETDIKGKNGEVKSGAEAIAIAQFQKALKGDTRAFEVIRDTSGQSVVQKVAIAEVDQNIIDDIEKMVMDDDLKE